MICVTNTFAGDAQSAQIAARNEETTWILEQKDHVNWRHRAVEVETEIAML